MTALPPQPGDVWRDLDPRGGPTFRILAVTDQPTERVSVVGLDGKRPRWVRLDRFRPNDNYRTGYTLVSREGDK